VLKASCSLLTASRIQKTYIKYALTHAHCCCCRVALPHLQLGAHMLRLHVVLNAPDGEDLATTTNRHADLAVLTGKAGQERKNRYMLQQAYQQAAAAATPGGPVSSGGASPPASGSQQRRVTPAPSPSTATTAEPLSADSMPHLMALAGEMAAAAAAAAGVSAGQVAGAEPAPEDVAQAVAAAMAALRRRQQEVQQQQGME
jgi:Ni,Fe-hydrogenase III small subunit